MPRKHLVRSSDYCYHLTTRSNNKEWFYLPARDCWNIFANKISLSMEKYGVLIHAFVLMSNHFHMLATSPKQNIDAFMRYFISLSTKTIQLKTKRINHIFGSRYKWSVLYNPISLAYVFKYIYRNPVRAEICKKVEEYPWSTLTNLQSPIPISEGFNNYWDYIPKQPEIRLNWLNLESSKSSEALIGKALRRFEFQFPKNSKSMEDRLSLAESYGIETICSDTIIRKKSIDPFSLPKI